MSIIKTKMAPNNVARNPRTGGISILETIKGRDSNKQPPPPARSAPRPLVARISLWTPRPSGRLNGGGGRRSGDSGNDSNDDDDDDEELASDQEYDENEHEDMELDDNAQLERRLKQARLPEHVNRVAMKEMQRLRRTPSFMSDYAVTRGYLELLAELPWNEQTPEHIDLKKSRRDLDHDHYGMQKLKERVLQYLAVRKLKQGNQTMGRSNQPILMFVGPPGTGKTSIAQSIASSLGRKFQRISLGGVADQSAIRGHRRTYIGAMPGRIIQGIKQVAVNNPVFLLDELDKMSASPQGDPSGALLEVLDPEQNHTFTDHYLNLPFDLSRVLFIATANSTENIPAALLDRMEVIYIPGYTHDEKFNIARRHLVPKQVIDNGLKMNMIIFKDDAIHKVIANYAREAGVRTLERKIAAICRVVAVKIVESQGNYQQHQQQEHATPAKTQPAGELTPSSLEVQKQQASDQQQQQQPLQLQQPLRLPVIVSADSLESFLGPVVYDRESSVRANVPGVAIGLAWTATGGEITFVEAEIMKGAKRESLVLTGQLGSVMRESAMLALNWIRANFQAYDSLPQTLGRDLVENTVHIHFPAGSVSKDGPSAGSAVICALMSLFSNISLPPDLAMTGEITLRGVVLKVGGIKAKVLAAHRAGIRRIILPARNESDLNDIPASVKEKMKFHLVSTVDEVIRIAFDNKLLPKANFLTGSGLTNKL